MMPIRLTPAVKWLLGLNLAAFIIQQTADRFFGIGLLEIFALIPHHFVMDAWLWQIVTYSFLHGDVVHLFLNLLMLAFIGGDLEGAWGTKQFLRFYAFCTIIAGCAYLIIQILSRDGLMMPMVGASGGIYGLLMAYGLIYSERTLLFMLLFPLKAKYFVWILVAVEFMTSLYSPHDRLSSVAHLGGMGAGFVYLFAGAYFRLRRKRAGNVAGKKKAKKSHLKLVRSDSYLFDKEQSEDSEDPKTWH